MTVWGKVTANMRLKLLSAALAVFVWLFATGAREGEREFLLPIEFVNLPQGLKVAKPPLERVDVRVSGQRLLLLRLAPSRLAVRLDMAHLREGTVRFSGLERCVSVPNGVRIARINPSSLELRLVKTESTGDVR